MKRKRLRTAAILSFFLGLTVTAASLAGLLVKGLYRDSATLVPQMRGNDLANLVLAIPLLVVSIAWSLRGSRRATLVWAGALAHLLYTYASVVAGCRPNQVFLLYIASFSLALFAFIALMGSMKPKGLRRRFAPSTPVRTISVIIAVGVLVFLYYGLSENIRVIIDGRLPESIEDRGLSSSMVHMLDLSVVLPTGALAALWLWRRKAWGYLLAAIFLVMGAISGCAILAADPLAATMGLPALPGQSPVFGIWAFLSALGVALLLGHLGSPKGKSEA